MIGARLGAVVLAVVTLAATAGAARSEAARSATLSINRIGNGIVRSSPAGIECGSVCSASFADGANVTLTAFPSPNYVFVSWSGGCTGSVTTCSVNVGRSASVTATFEKVLDLSTVTIRGSYRQSVFRGSLTVTGNAFQPLSLVFRLTRAANPSATVATIQFAVPAGRFSAARRLPGRFFPGSYRAVYSGTTGSGLDLGPGEVPTSLAAPREGVVSAAWVSRLGSSRKVTRVARGIRALTAFFVYAARPAAGSQVKALWYFNGRVARPFPVPTFLPVVQVPVRGAPGQPLPVGSYKCELRSRGKLLKTVRVVVR